MSKKEKMVRALGLPEDVILRVPQIELTGRGHLRLDHYRSILEFQENRLVVSTSQGVFTIEGEKIHICFSKEGELDVEGHFTSVRLGGDSA
ncbi:MAG TPA: YabP/YqfC family sporulation protein [Candidatus Faecimorpha stercoravium]|nr:YabP/YqfC family sporulation protein [Candidatus Faecimorpha stercoravium]